MSPTSYRTAPPRGKVKQDAQKTPNFSLSIRLEYSLQIQNRKSEIRNSLVGLGRVELPTSRLSGVRSNQLSYRPISLLRAPLFRTYVRILPQKRATLLFCAVRFNGGSAR